MPSLFAKAFAALASPHLLHQFGERGNDGQLAPLYYRDPRLGMASEPFPLTGISSPIRAIVETSLDLGGLERRETKTWQIPRDQFDAINVFHAQRNATVVDHDTIDPYEDTWHVDVDQCVWGPIFVTLALKRSPRIEGHEVRRAAV